MRFSPEAGGTTRQRLVMMSRNLTRDRSWDVALQLEGEETEKNQGGNQPLVDLIDWMPGRKPRALQELRISAARNKSCSVGVLVSVVLLLACSGAEYADEIWGDADFCSSSAKNGRKVGQPA
jgi:hypothetical protein